MKLPFLILVLILIGGTIFLFGRNFLSTQTANVAPNLTQTPSPTVQPTTKPQAEILVTSPLPNQIITNPLEITGKAPGNWFFEAVAPISLVDSNGITIATGKIEAQGDWQTTDLVRFTGILNFTDTTAKTGQLILENDNPSGLPENSKKVVIPIRFK